MVLPLPHCSPSASQGLLVANTSEAWFRALGRLVSHVARRRSIAEKADREVRSRHTLAAGAHRHREDREVVATSSTSIGRIA